MTEKEIQLLGFQKEEHLDEDPFYYYVYKIVDGFEFISCANDEVKEDQEWYVDVFNTDPYIRFTEFGDVQGLINIFEKHIVKP